MKKLISTILVTILMFLSFADTVKADDLGTYKNFYGLDFKSMEITWYCLKGLTATEVPTREGICAGNREILGQTAFIFENNDGEIGELIGVYEVLDTGTNEKIKKGLVLDIWNPSYNECIQNGRQKVFVFFSNEQIK